MAIYSLNALGNQNKNALALANFSAAAYKDPEGATSFCRSQAMGCTPFSNKATQGFVASDAQNVVVSFRGTSESSDTLTNLNAAAQLVDGFKGKVHSGYKKALDDVLHPLTDHVRKHAFGAEKQLWVTGHSLGGALAALYAAHLNCTQDLKVWQVVTFGQPAIGDKEFCKFYSTLVGGSLQRYVNVGDTIPYLGSYSQVSSPNAHYLDESGKDKPEQSSATAWMIAVTNLWSSIKSQDNVFHTHHAIRTYIQRLQLNQI
jgi:hypothetical protein